MQHTIKLDQTTERILSVLAINNEQSKDEILLLAVKEFLQQQSSKKDLKQFLEPYQLNMDGFRFDREIANKR